MNFDSIDSIISRLAANIDSPTAVQLLAGNLSPEEKEAVVSRLCIHAEVHLAQKHKEEAYQLIRAARQFAEGLPEQEFMVEHKLLNLYELDNLTDMALSLYDELYKKWMRSRQHPLHGAIVRMEKAILLEKLGKRKEALSLLRYASKRFELYKDEYNWLACRYNISSILFDLFRIKTCTKISINTLAQFELDNQYKDSIFCANFNLQLANIYDNMDFGDDDLALLSYKRALKTYKKLKNHNLVASIYYQLGRMEICLRRYHLAEHYFKQALRIRTKQDCALGYTRLRFYSAVIFKELGLKREALELFDAVLEYPDILKAGDYPLQARWHKYRIEQELYSKEKQTMTLEEVPTVPPTEPPADHIYNKISYKSGYYGWSSEGYRLPPYPGFAENCSEYENDMLAGVLLGLSQSMRYCEIDEKECIRFDKMRVCIKKYTF